MWYCNEAGLCQCTHLVYVVGEDVYAVLGNHEPHRKRFAPHGYQGDLMSSHAIASCSWLGALTTVGMSAALRIHVNVRT
jgi:hypothetical protein